MSEKPSPVDWERVALILALGAIGCILAWREPALLVPFALVAAVLL